VLRLRFNFKEIASTNSDSVVSLERLLALTARLEQEFNCSNPQKLHRLAAFSDTQNVWVRLGLVKGTHPNVVGSS